MQPRTVALLSGGLVAAAAGAALLWYYGGFSDADRASPDRADGYARRTESLGDDAPLRYDTEYPTMHYASAARSDAIAKLEARLASGTAKLDAGPRGYLDSVLAALDVDPSSQTLVFSQTSLQSRRINSRTPRAIYFDDDVYVAWVQNGPLEIAALDPNLGPVFYTLDNPAPEDKKPKRPAFQHQIGRCLSCHDSYSLSGGGVPRFIVGSGYTGPSGNLVAHEGWILVDDSTPLEDRWGGWYVTGRSGAQKHLGNVLIRNQQDFDRLDELRRGNLDTLDGLFDTKPYLTDKSDIVALLILEHQVNAQNAITRANFDARTAIDRERGASRAKEGYELGAEQLSAETRKAIDDAVEPLVRTLVFDGETPLTAPISGEPKFVAQFMSRAIKDPSGRSLRDLDMQTRMFRYPLSYVVYSQAFDALPRAVREGVYRRIAALLRDESGDAAVARLSADERRSILEIFAATKNEFAASLGR